MTLSQNELQTIDCANNFVDLHYRWLLAFHGHSSASSEEKHFLRGLQTRTIPATHRTGRASVSVGPGRDRLAVLESAPFVPVK